MNPINDIATALERLELQYPHEEVSVWAVRNCKDKWHKSDYFMAYVGSADPSGNRVYSSSEDSPVIQLIADAGERNQDQILKRKIAELKSQLAHLESEAAKSVDQYAETPMEINSHGSVETI